MNKINETKVLGFGALVEALSTKALNASVKNRNLAVIKAFSEYYGGDFGKFLAKDMKSRFNQVDVLLLIDKIKDVQQSDKAYKIMFELIGVSYLNYFLQKTFGYSAQLRTFIPFAADASTGNKFLDNLIADSIGNLLMSEKVVKAIKTKLRQPIGIAARQVVDDLVSLGWYVGSENSEENEDDQDMNARKKDTDDLEKRVAALAKEVGSEAEAKRLLGEGLVDFLGSLFNLGRKVNKVYSPIDLASIIVKNIKIKYELKQEILNNAISDDESSESLMNPTPKNVAKLITKPTLLYIAKQSKKLYLDKSEKMNPLNAMLLGIFTDSVLVNLIEIQVERNIKELVPEMKELEFDLRGDGLARKKSGRKPTRK